MGVTAEGSVWPGYVLTVVDSRNDQFYNIVSEMMFRSMFQ